MARAVLVALAVCAARAEEYAGGAMPQYGGAADYERGLTDDYRGHSPDAPAPLDYKYEEQQSETDKPPKYVNDAERWQRSGRTQQRRPAREGVKDQLERRGPNTDPEEVPQSKTSRRRLKHSQRDRRDKPRRRESSPRRHHAVEVVAALGRYGRAKHDEENDHYLDNNYHDRRDKYLEDNDFYSRKETTARVIRRKPRDRVFATLPPQVAKGLRKEQGFIEEEVDEKLDRPVKDDKSGEREYSTGDESDWPEGWARPTLSSAADARVEADTESAVRGRGGLKLDAYEDYNDYYNIKKLENLKTKLPTLLRRTSTRALTVLQSATWSRRAGGGAAPPAPASTVPPSRTTTNATTATVEWMPVNVTELSLAQQFRLAIRNRMLTKSQKVTSKATKKPPVLLLVTKKMPTVVMVDPAVNGDRRFRARAHDSAGDSPETLEKVKRFMRSKLVAQAANLRDLTENWNETVCDYIDVGVLRDTSSAAPAPASAATLLLGVILFYCLVDL